jgi:thymidylate synthase (FAD)
MIQHGATPEIARSVLPNALKTEIVMTANLREWREICRQRCAKAAHPQMREVAMMVLAELRRIAPDVFADLAY